MQIGENYLVYFKILLFSIAQYLVLDQHTFEILFYLMTLDTVTGIIKAIVLKERRFTFQVLLWGLLTKMGVLIIPVSLALLAKGLEFDFRWFVLMVMHVLLISETFSIFSNTLSIKRREPIKSVDFVSMLLNAVRNGLKKMIDRLLTQIEGIEDKK